MKRILLFLFIHILLGLVTGCESDRTPLDFNALERQVRQGDEAALRKTAQLLGHPVLSERAYALLMEQGETSVPFLMELIEDPDPARREAAIAALGNLGAPQAADRIAQILADTALERRYVAAWALGKINDPAFTGELITALDDANFEVRRQAVRALVRIHRPAVPALIEALPHASPQMARGIIHALGDIGDRRALEALLEQPHADHRAETMLALGKLRDPQATDALIAGLTDEDWQVRMNAAMALGPLGAQKAEQPLRQTLEDEVTVVREWSARSLEMITGQRTLYRNAKGEMVPPDNVYH
jgi:HEAT repeat protein